MCICVCLAVSVSVCTRQYAATPGRGKYRPSQETPIDNFVMAGDFASQKYLGSMEGAVRLNIFVVVVIIITFLE